MRTLILLLSVFAITGCAEAVQGPRVVVYSDDMLYVRYLPWRDSRSTVELLAGSACEESGRIATLQGSDQYALLDLRYVTFRCANPFPTDGDAAIPDV